MEIQTPTFAVADELYMRQPTPESNRMSMDTQQAEAASPLSNDMAQAHVYAEVHMQIDHQNSPRRHGRVAVDMISSDSPHPPTVNPIHAFIPAPTRNLIPRRRVAGRDLRPLETDNTKGEASKPQNHINIDRSKQRRRPNQRPLLPKSPPLQNPKNASSPQSSKSTPDSARTDSSFASASTATQATSPGSSVITTPSHGTGSPATPFTPSDQQLVCRDCGKTFQTPSGQKCVCPYL
jgi:hypothetical protein